MPGIRELTHEDSICSLVDPCGNPRAASAPLATDPEASVGNCSATEGGGGATDPEASVGNCSASKGGGGTTDPEASAGKCSARKGGGGKNGTLVRSRSAMAPVWEEESGLEAHCPAALAASCPLPIVEEKVVHGPHCA